MGSKIEQVLRRTPDSYPKLNTLSLDQRAVVVAEMLQILQRSEPVAVVDLLDGALASDRMLQFKLFQAFERGFHPPLATMRLLLNRSYMLSLPTRWQTAAIFTEDSTFSQERFMLITSAWLSSDVLDPDVLNAAIAQVIRLLAAGQVDLEYLSEFTRLRQLHNYGNLRVQLLAHDSSWLRSLTDSLNAVQGQLRPASTLPGGLHRRQQTLVEQAMIEREQLFAKVWLPAILPPQEYAPLRHVQVGMLRELYPELWQAGYDAYRATMIERNTPSR